MEINSVLLIGRPGSGKGTQATRLTEHLGWMHFSTGNLFKEMRDSGSVIGNRIKDAYDQGKLMPDWFATYLFEDTMLKLGHEHGIVCEGYPRSLAQAEVFDDIMTWLARPYSVIHLLVSEEETMRRMLERAKTENRPDSNSKEAIQARFATYEAATAPVLDFFREKGKLVEIDGAQSVEDVEKSVRAALGK